MSPNTNDTVTNDSVTNDTVTNIAITPRERAVLVCACLLAIAALLLNVAAESLDHGYTRYGAIAEHMVRTGDYVVPWLGNEIYLLKPPLQSWLIALPIAWLGEVPNWVTHVPNLLGAAASLIATWFLARRLLGNAQLATLASLVLATLASFVDHARGERVDPLFADSLVTALTFFHAAIHDDGKRTGKLLIATWLSLIVALMTKGPFGLIFFLAVAIPYALSVRRARILVSGASFVGATLAIGVAAIWPVLLVQRVGWDEVKHILATAVFAQHERGPFYYLTAIPQAILPWTLFLPAIVAYLWQGKPWRDAAGLRLPCLWIAIIIVLLHLSEAKAERYLLPLLAPTSILLVAMFDRARGGIAETVRITGIIGCALLALYALGAPFLRLGDYGVPRAWLPAMIVVALITGYAGWSFVRTREPGRSALSLAIALLLLIAVRDVAATKKLRRLDGRKEAVAALAPILKTNEIGVVGVDSATQGMLEMIVRHSLPRYTIEHVSDQAASLAATIPSHLLIHVESDRDDIAVPALAEYELVTRLHLDELDYVLVRSVRLAKDEQLARVESS